MFHRFIVIAEASISPGTLQDCRTLATEFAGYLGEPVAMAVLPKARMRLARTTLLVAGGAEYVEELQPSSTRSAAPMSSAEFLWREDGRPDWAEMWTGFCELALYGGPPHRGDENPVVAPVDLPAEDADTGFNAMVEIRRGIWETTGLFAELAEPGWIAVTCQSKKMAAWLCATIILENVDARCEGERLFLPASPDFELKDEVKSVITVLAKTHHYWKAHVEAQRQAAGAV
jgi:hypothetical protein